MTKHQQQSVAEQLNQARHLHETGQLAAALAGYDVLLNTHPHHAEARFGRALTNIQFDRPSQALEDLHVLLKTSTNDLVRVIWLDVQAQCGQTGQAQQWLAAQAKLKGMYALLARHFRLNGALQFPDSAPAASTPPTTALIKRCDQVLAVYQQGHLLSAMQAAWQLTEAHPRDVFGWKLLGATLSTLHLWHGAQAAMQQALRLEPGDVEALNNLGMLFAQTGQLPAARQCLQEAVRLRPDRYSLQVNLGCIYNDLGLLDQAEHCLRLAMAQAPEAPEVLNNLGNILRRQARFEEAQSILRRSVQRYPDKPVGWNNLGCVLRDLRQYDEAAQMFRTALACAPDHPEIYVNLAASLQCQHQFDAAAAILEPANQRWPLDAGICSQLAWLRRQCGQDEAALAPYLAALAQAPEHPILLTDLAAQLLSLMRPAEAEVLLSRALLRNPRLMIAYRHLAMALRQQGRIVEAREVLRHGLQQQPEHAATLSDLGALLLEFDEQEEAEQLLSQAVQAAPREALLAANLAELYQMQGREEASRSLIDQALALALPVERPQVVASAMLMLPLTLDDPRLHDLDELYARKEEWAKTEQIKFSMALGKVRENTGCYEAAFAAYQAGNQLQAELQPFDVAADEALFDTLRSFYNPALLDRWIELRTDISADDRVPTFIVGMPRSGTSLVEQILSSHPSVHGLGESLQINAYSAEATDCLREEEPKQGRAKLRNLAERYITEMWQKSSGKRVVTDKMPENFLHLGLIALLLPQARIIHCERSAMDTCFSCYATPFRNGHLYSNRQDTLAGRYLRYRALMDHWRQVLPPGRMLTIRYESLVANPEPVVHQMLDFLGLPWHGDCLNFHQTRRLVRTASVAQVRQPIYDRSIGRWRHFEPWLAPLWAELSSVETAEA